MQQLQVQHICNKTVSHGSLQNEYREVRFQSWEKSGTFLREAMMVNSLVAISSDINLPNSLQREMQLFLIPH